MERISIVTLRTYSLNHLRVESSGSARPDQLHQPLAHGQLTKELVRYLPLILYQDRRSHILDFLCESHDLAHLTIGHNRSIFQNPGKLLKEILGITSTIIGNSPDEFWFVTEIEIDLSDPSQKSFRLE